MVRCGGMSFRSPQEGGSILGRLNGARPMRQDADAFVELSPTRRIPIEKRMKTPVITSTILVLGGLLSPIISSFAQSVPLFSCRGTQIQFGEDYNWKVTRIRKGDSIDLCGKKVTVEKKLGIGNTTVIYLLDNGNVIRFPQEVWQSRYVNFTIAGETELNRHNIPHVKLIESRKNHWIIAENLGQKSDWIDFETFKDRFRPKNTQHTHMLKKLEAFTLRTVLFESVADLHEENLVFSYARDEWVAMDWNADHTFWDAGKKPKSSNLTRYILDEFYTENEALEAEIEKIRLRVLEFRNEIHEQAKLNPRFNPRSWLRSRVKQFECTKLLRTEVSNRLVNTASP